MSGGHVSAIDVSQLARIECEGGAKAVGGAHKQREPVIRPAIKSAYASYESAANATLDRQAAKGLPGLGTGVQAVASLEAKQPELIPRQWRGLKQC